MTLGPFHSSQPGYVDRALDPFFYNRSLQQEALELRLGEYTDDLRHDMHLVGSAIVRQQENAANRYRDAARATTDAVHAQTAEIAGMRREQAQHAERLAHAVEDSAQLVRAGIDETRQSIQTMQSELTDQLTHVRWALDQQSQVLSGILETLRGNRKNECRQLVDQGVENLVNGYLPEAKERLEAALVYDNTDHEVHQQLGFVSIRLGDIDRAIEHFKKALAFLPKVPAYQRQKVKPFAARAATHVARAYYAKRAYDDAAAYLEHALEIEPDNAKNWYDLAVMRAYLRYDAEAAQAVARAVELRPFYFGRALADPELEPVRATIETQLLNATQNISTQLDTVAAEVSAFVAKVREAERVIGVSLGAVPDVEAIVRSARQENTYVVFDHAIGSLTRDKEALRVHVFRAIDDAAKRAEQDRATRLAGHEASVNQKHASITAEVEESVKRRSGVNTTAWAIYIPGTIIGGIIGAMIGHGAGGCAGVFFGFLAGFAVVGLVVGVIRKIIFSSIDDDQKALHAEIGRVGESVPRMYQEEARRLETRLSELEALRGRFGTISDDGGAS